MKVKRNERKMKKGLKNHLKLRKLRKQNWCNEFQTKSGLPLKYEDH